MTPRRIALAGLLGALVLALGAGPAAAGTRGPDPSQVFDIPGPVAPPRDAVIYASEAAASRASASAQRYPVNDGRGRNVEISVSSACQLTCTDANPQQIASFLGTVIHGDEMGRLQVELVTPVPEMTAICGPDALACYFPGDNRMVISGNDDTASDGATREFIIAHEYGHHVAQHRRNPPFNPTIAYGPKRWATFERVCQGTQRGEYFPGDQGSHYYENPGEAFAESFAFNRFRNSPVQWAWVSSLRPTAESFRAIRADTLRPWNGRVRTVITGRLRRPNKTAVKRVVTPLDGVLTLRLEGPRGADFDLALRSRAGRVLRSSRGLGPNEQVSFLVCGQARFKAVIERAERVGGRYRLIVRRP
jgi:hypothetical protein